MRFSRLAPFSGASFDIDGWCAWLDGKKIDAQQQEFELRRARRPTQQHGTEEYGQSLSDGGESEVSSSKYCSQTTNR